MKIRDDGQVHDTAINVDCATLEDLGILVDHPAIHLEVKRYAAITLHSRACRLAGRIAEAMRAESKLERIYATLPENLRW